MTYTTAEQETFHRFNPAGNNERLIATLKAPVRVDCTFQPSQPQRRIMACGYGVCKDS